MPQQEGETREQYLARLDAELVARMAADEEEAADAELARLFPALASEAGGSKPAPGPARGEGAFARFNRLEAERKAAEANAEAKAIAEIEADEQAADPTFLQKAAAPATDALRGREAQLNQDFESGDTQRLFQNQSTDSNN
jgi:hypothetical protein